MLLLVCCIFHLAGLGFIENFMVDPLYYDLNLVLGLVTSVGSSFSIQHCFRSETRVSNAPLWSFKSEARASAVIFEIWTVDYFLDFATLFFHQHRSSLGCWLAFFS